MLSKFVKNISYLILFLGLCSIFEHRALARSKSARQENSISVDVRFAQDVTFKKEIMDLVKSISSDSKLQNDFTDNASKKSYLENRGIDLLTKMLKSYGYYSAQVETEETDRDNKISFLITPNQRYTISKITIDSSNSKNPRLIFPKQENLSLKEQQYANAVDILNTENDIFSYIQEHNCLIHLAVNHFAIVNQIDYSIEITFVIEASSNANISYVSFTGLHRVQENYARKLVSIKNGQCYQNSSIIKAQSELQKSGLFSSVSPLEPKIIDQNGQVPLFFKVRERQDKTAKAGISYVTTMGLGATLGWRHRNLFGSGENIETELFGNQKEQSFDTNYTKPFFYRDDQILKLGLSLINQKSKAFDSKKIEIFAGIERKLSDKVTAGIGSQYSLAAINKPDINKIRIKETASIISTPIFITRDSRNNILDPHNGNMINFETIPNLRSGSKKDFFLKNKIIGTAYFSPFDISLDPVIAMRAASGNILAGKTTTIPETEKFFVGGSNSLRGYEYQLASTLDINKKPIGGLSFVETSLELRTKFRKNFGLVIFLDGGRNFRDRYLNFKDPLFWGAGIGLRYYTALGPLRVDIAFPTNRRKKIDKSFHLYFNIGQSF